MLRNERISEAQSSVRSYLADGLLTKEWFRNIVFETYLRNHRESLLVARKLFNENLSNLWVVVISYYSMFYIANALLYKLGYKVGSKVAHKVTSDALIVFVRNKLKNQLIQQYDIERVKRSVFQYESTEEVKFGKAKTSLDRAEQFSKEIEKLLLD